MDLGVAKRARLKLRGLIVKGRRARCVRERSGMALQAQQIDVAQFEQVRIGRSVRGVTGLAALDLHDFMLKDEWSLLVGMALEANRVLRRRHT